MMAMNMNEPVVIIVMPQTIERCVITSIRRARAGRVHVRNHPRMLSSQIASMTTLTSVAKTPGTEMMDHAAMAPTANTKVRNHADPAIAASIGHRV